MKKTAIVTGASNGIGRSVATIFATKGFNVIIADIDSKNGPDLHERLIKNELNSAFIECDVSDPDSIDNLVEKTITHYGHIDVLINNAGISVFRRQMS